MDKNVKVGIVTSLIATIIFIYFVNPIFALLGHIVPRVARTIYAGYTDHLYAHAAAGVPFDTALVILLLFVTVTFGFVVGVVSAELTVRRASKSGEPASERGGGHSTLGLIVPLVVLLISLSAMTWEIWFQHRLVTAFEQHLAVLAPYMSAEDVKLVRSKWALMKTEKQYEDIYRVLRKKASENSIELPAPGIY